MSRENYESFADRYAEMTETKPHNALYERPATRSLLPDVKGLRVLDAGCGPGVYTEWLLDHGAKVVAFDVTPRMVELTRLRVSDRATLHVADLGQPLGFAADAEFDLVVCPLVLDYIKDWGPTFKEFARVLKPGGTLVFSCGHPMTDFTHPDIQGPEIYYNVEQIEMTWGGFGDPKPVITSYRRPFSAIINPLIAAGLTLDHVLEARPLPAFQERDPRNYDDLMRAPGFIFIRAKKA